jgi:hypothetical protein
MNSPGDKPIRRIVEVLVLPVAAGFSEFSQLTNMLQTPIFEVP